MNLLCEQGDLALRPLEDRQEEYALLRHWLSQEEISRYYGGDGEREVRSIQKHVKIGDVCSCLILQNLEPIGYLQFYEITDPDEKAELRLCPYRHPFGIDLFLGFPQKLGQGVGTRCLKMTCHFLFSKRDADALCIDPRIDNLRAIRCYQKAGFFHVTTKEHGEKVLGRWIACDIMHRLPESPSSI